MKKFLILFAFLGACASAPPLTPAQTAVNAAFAADQEICYQSNDNAKDYVACVDKVQRCAATSPDPLAYQACKNGGVPK